MSAGKLAAVLGLVGLATVLYFRSSSRESHAIFEPDVRPGWHPIEVRTRQKDLVVRARSGYIARSGPEPFQR